MKMLLLQLLMVTVSPPTRHFATGRLSSECERKDADDAERERRAADRQREASSIRGG